MHTHVVGPRVKAMVRAFREGDVETARRSTRSSNRLYELLKVQTNPIAIKAALNLLGHDVGGLRLPLVEANEGEVARVRDCLERLGVAQPRRRLAPAVQRQREPELVERVEQRQLDVAWWQLRRRTTRKPTSALLSRRSGRATATPSTAELRRLERRSRRGRTPPRARASSVRRGLRRARPPAAVTVSDPPRPSSSHETRPIHVVVPEPTDMASLSAVEQTDGR